MLRRNMFWWASWLVIAVWLISACRSAPTPKVDETHSQPSTIEEREGGTEELEPIPLGEGEKIKVIVTTNILADIVSQIGAGTIELTELLPVGTDPHTYTATPKDVVSVTDAHVLFANGANLEGEFLPELTQDTQAAIVYVSNGVELRKLESGETHEREENVDPHTWTTPANAVVFVRNIEQALSSLDPANASTYKTNATKYIAELEALDEWIKEQITTIPVDQRKLVTDHQIFGYYAERYGLEQIGAVVPAFSTAAEPSARELAGLEDLIREHGVRAVFVGITVNPSLARQIAADTGVQLVTLYTGSLGPPGSEAETYSEYIRYNTTAIVKGLR